MCSKRLSLSVILHNTVIWNNYKVAKYSVKQKQRFEVFFWDTTSCSQCARTERERERESVHMLYNMYGVRQSGLVKVGRNSSGPIESIGFRKWLRFGQTTASLLHLPSRHVLIEGVCGEVTGNKTGCPPPDLKAECVRKWREAKPAGILLLSCGGGIYRYIYIPLTADWLHLLNELYSNYWYFTLPTAVDDVMIKNKKLDR